MEKRNTLNFIPRTILGLLFFGLTACSSSIGFGQDEPPKPPYSEPPKLALKFKDNFQKDSRSKYTISGKKSSALWTKGKLTLGDGAILNRDLNAGSWVEMKLDLGFPKLTEEGQTSELKIWLDLEGATDSFVWFRQKREKGKTRSAIFIVDTSGEWNEPTKQQPITRPLIIEGPLAGGIWSIEYRQGLWSVKNMKSKLELFGYIKNSRAEAKKLVASNSLGETVFKSFQISVDSAVQFIPTAGVAKKLSQARQLNSEVVRLYQAGRVADATPIASRVLNTTKSLLGKFHPDYAASLNNLGLLHNSTGAYEKAVSLFRQAIEVQEKVLGEEHPDYGTSLNNLAALYQSMGAYKKAEPLFLQSVEIDEKVLGKEHPGYAASLNNLAVIYKSMGAFEKAEPLYLRAKTIVGRVLGEEHPHYAASLNNLAEFYRSMGAHKKAEPLYLQAIEIEEKVRGKDRPFYAATLNNLAGLYQSIGAYDKAESLYLQAMQIRAQVLGKEHLDYALCLNNLAGLYRLKGAYEKAERLCFQANAIAEKVLGKEHPSYAISLNNLAGVYSAMGAYEKAEPLYLQAKEIEEKVLGREHPGYAASLNNLASLYMSMGLYEKAEPLLLQARKLREKVFGKEHPDYATSLNNLAFFYKLMGSYDKAESLYLRAKAIEEKVLGKEHPSYATSLNNLAELYKSTGAYEKAEPLLLQASKIRENVLGKEHPDYATSLNNLAGVYLAMEAYEKAEPLYIQARQIREKVLGKEHPTYSTSLNNLAFLYVLMGAFEKAEPLYLQANAIDEKVLGQEHPSYAASLGNLAGLYRSLRAYDKAEPLYIRAKHIVEQTLGKDHPKYAVSINNLAAFYGSTGASEKAESLLLQAKEIREKALGKKHPDYATSLNNLAVIYDSMGNYAKAEQHYRDALEIVRTNFNRFSAIQSGKQQQQYASTFDNRLSSAISVSLKLGNRAQQVLDDTLNWKGMNLVREKQNLRLSTRPETKQVFGELRLVKSQLTRLIQVDPTSKGWTARRDSLLAEEERLEKEISLLAAKLGVNLSDIDASDIKLPQGSCLVDFRKFSYSEPDPDNRGSFRASPHYLALILRPDGSVKMLDLGSARPIELAINNWRRPIEQANVESRSIDRIAQQAMDQAGLELRRLIWEPLEPHLSQSEMVIVSPDGGLGRLSLIALPGKKPGSYLLEERKIVYMAVPSLLKELLSKPVEPIDGSMKSLLVGGIDYGKASETSTAELLAFRNNRILRDLKFSSLAESGNEVTEIQRQFKNATLLTQNLASESRFKRGITDHRLLHIATHGFFKSPEKFMSELPTQEQPGFVSERSQLKFLNENPNLLSGLAFADANGAASKTIDDAEDDGILFSSEIAMLPMEHVELAVLSACETSLGTDDAPGEGLIGIQRAFQVAGAKSTIASYWKVDDRATQLLMNKFYENLLDNSKKSKTEGTAPNSTTVRLDALRDAQLWMLNNPIVASTTSRGEPVEIDPARIKKLEPKPAEKGLRTHPRYWAAFILSGDWR